MNQLYNQATEQFGNLVVVRRGKRRGFVGIPEVFVASVIQAQPLAELTFLAESGQAIELTETGCESSAVSHKRSFDGGSFLVFEERVVKEDTISCQIRIEKKEDTDDLKLRLNVSGAVLFSPQGVPYHWQDEKLMQSAVSSDALTVAWQDKVKLSLKSSQPLQDGFVGRLDEEDVRKDLYFSTFNAKKRYTYWVDQNVRNSVSDTEQVTSRNVAYSGNIDVVFPDNGQTWEYEISLAVETNQAKTSGNEGFAAAKQERREQWEDFCRKVPEFSSPDQKLMDSYYKSWYVLFSNRMQHNDQRFQFPFTSVNKFHYYNQFFWDSAFHAIAWMWFNQEEPAESELKNFVLNQWRNGMIPYELFLFDVNGREWMESDFLTTAGTQPPVLAISIMEIYKRYGNKDFLAFFYEPLLKYEEWLWKYRDIDKRGLSHCFHIWETGTDNSPKFDEVTRNRLMDPQLEGVDFNVFIYILRKNLVEIADILGVTPPDRLQERMAATKASMNEVMLDKEDSFYYDVCTGDSRKIRVKAFSGMLPLITDIPSPEVREDLINRYLLSEKEFNSPCPIPSVSMSEPSFNSSDFWRGANWPQITWSFIYGLKQSDPEIAGTILDKYLSTSTQKHDCNEYCDSVTGANVGLPFQGWGTLYTDLVIRGVVGIDPQPDGFAFNPLETRYTHFSLKKLFLHGLEVSIERQGDNWEFILGNKRKLVLSRTIPFTVEKNDQTVQLTFAKSEFRPELVTFFADVDGSVPERLTTNTVSFSLT